MAKTEIGLGNHGKTARGHFQYLEPGLTPHPSKGDEESTTMRSRTRAAMR